jgi:GntR family transcriptional regulator
MVGRDRFSIEPLYAQVRRHLAERIRSGAWKPGAVLPNEQDLARELGVSPGTVRKALDTLEEAKLVIRRQGKGTFVLDQTSQELTVRFSNIRDREGRRVAGDMKLLARSTGEASESERAKLHLKPGDEVLRLVRLRTDDGQPFLYEEATLALGRFPGLDASCVEGERISALAQQHGIHLARSSEQVGISAAPAHAADALKIAVGTPVLKLDRIITAEDGSPIQWRIALCHLDKSKTYVAEIN